MEIESRRDLIVSEQGGIWILGEIDAQQNIARPALDLFSRGRTLAADAEKSLSAFFIGSDITAAIQKFLTLLPERTYVFENAAYAEYEPEMYLQALEGICRQYQPEIFLAAHTAYGQDLLSRLAARLGAGIATDCIDLEIDPATGGLFMTKPIYGGNAVAVFTLDSSPQLGTVRAKTAAPVSTPAKEPELIVLDSTPAPVSHPVKRLEIRKEEIAGLRLEDAQIIVSGGRGVGGPDGFETLRSFADLLGGAVGASRPPCDLGWAPSPLQVGLTGKNVAPKAYFAIAISGAMQHITGMFESQYIIAINKDKGANIFKTADYGVVGDYREVLPSLINKLKEFGNESA
jgi:electron transfer flavoprotein alpha subunit